MLLFLKRVEWGIGMVSSKGKRKIVVDGVTYFWFVSKNERGIPRIHIMSEDKKTMLERPMFDTETPVIPAYIETLIKENVSEYANI